ncbi:complement C1q-like protein 2 [Ylistrum balloti]|uniref:complement C1q-like protein 2 n=1 Tax=Ylistrum balloti TaxID=509963 RepID=UPI002905F3C0|nr:complement C1q-like protein 2 [Ylistrum balloti]
MAFLLISTILFSISLVFGKLDANEREELRADNMKWFHSLEQEMNTIRMENQKLRLDNEQLSDRLSTLESAGSFHRLGRQTGSNVAFYAMIRQNIPHITQRQTLHFDSVQTNDGNAYNPSTGTFMCPEAGTYVFHWSINQAVPTNGIGGTISTSLLRNGMIEGALQTGDNNVPTSSSNSVILHLHAGDRVYVQVTQASSDAYIGQTYSGFSGFKLF